MTRTVEDIAFEVLIAIGYTLASGIIATSIVLGISSCASLKGQTPAQVATTILSDAAWGVEAAHSQLWLSDADTAYIEEALHLANDAIAANPQGALAVARVALQDAELFLQADSRLRPYFDAAIGLL